MDAIDSIPEKDIIKALELTTELQKRLHDEHLDPRAFRIVLKMMLKIDDHFAQQVLSKEDDFALELFASKLALADIKADQEMQRREQNALF
jgi:hypothetical protein